VLAALRVAALRRLLRVLLRAPIVRRRLQRARREAIDRDGLDPDIAALLGLEDATEFRGSLRTAEAARRKSATTSAILDDPPHGDVETSDRTFLGGSICARLYRPRGLAAPSPALVYLHGGGFTTGDLDTHATLCRRLALAGSMRVIAVAYRRAPEHRFPAALDDARAAFRAIRDDATSLGIDPHRLAIGGDSAGANLAAVVARDPSSRAALQVLIYPCVDATCSAPSHRTRGAGYGLTPASLAWYYDQYLGDDASLRVHPDVSPARASDLAGAAPALVYTAGFDPLCDEGETYAQQLRDAGVEARHVRFRGLIHGFVRMTGISRGALAATETIGRETGEALRAVKAGAGRASSLVD
jgi:acetyl esterase